MARRAHFVLDGKVLTHAGSIGALQLQVTPEEWSEMIKSTGEYIAFAETIRDYAAPILEESWEREDERLVRRLRVTMERMRVLDPLGVANHSAHFESYRKAAVRKAQVEAAQVKAEIAAVRMACATETPDNSVSVTEL